MFDFLSTALTGGLVGGLLRFLPSVLDFFKTRQANAHELAMMDKTMERDKALADQEVDKLQVESQIVLDKGGLAALKEAIAAQGRPTGDPKIDRRSASVRPNVTYAFLWAYGLVKVALVTIAVTSALRTNMDILDMLAGAVGVLWTEADMGLLAGIINFWFLDRVIRKNEGK